MGVKSSVPRVCHRIDCPTGCSVTQVLMERVQADDGESSPITGKRAARLSHRSSRQIIIKSSARVGETQRPYALWSSDLI